MVCNTDERTMCFKNQSDMGKKIGILSGSDHISIHGHGKCTNSFFRTFQNQKAKYIHFNENAQNTIISYNCCQKQF